MATNPPLWLVGQWEQYLRIPSSFDTSTNPPTPSWDPPLTADEQTTLADLQRMARFGISTTWTLAEFQAIKGNLADLRPGSALENSIATFRTRTDAQWNALTATQRTADMIAWDRYLTDALADIRAVLAALLRDS